MSWDEILEKLLAIRADQDLPANFVVESIELCGHPARSIWRKIAKALGYTEYWADHWKYLPGQETEEPDAGAIDWEKYPIPPPPIARPTLPADRPPEVREKPVSRSINAPRSIGRYRFRGFAED
jgi:hypothetical protein